MTESAIASPFASSCAVSKSDVGIKSRLTALLFGSPDVRKAHGGYRAAFVEKRIRRPCREGAASKTVVFHIDENRFSKSHGLPKIWLSERMASSEGKGEHVRAFTSYYPSAADKGGVKALGLAERFFAEGIGIADRGAQAERLQCFQAAELLYMHAMRRGNLQACTRLGVLYRFDMCRGSYMKDVLFKKGKHVRSLSLHETAFKLFRKAAVQGDAEAMVQLGEMLAEGAGCAKNRELAFKFFKSALKKCTGMEFAYIEGSVIDPEIRQKVHLTLASDLFNASHAGRAALHIAESFEEGRGTRQSFEMARIWYEIAYSALSVSFDHGFWYSKRDRCKARQGFLRALQEINGKY